MSASAGSGSLLVDRNGLCIRAEGSLTADLSGTIAALQQRARSAGTAGATACTLENGLDILVRDDGDFVVAVARAASLPDDVAAE